MNTRSRIVKDFLSDENLYIFNDDSITYLHPASGSASSIDQSLCDPDIILIVRYLLCRLIQILYKCINYTWMVNGDLNSL